MKALGKRVRRVCSAWGWCSRTNERAQVFTLEGFVAASILLLAVLFVLQSTVLVPSSGGPLDRNRQHQLRLAANDVLDIAHTRGDLSYVVRYWDADRRTFYGAADRQRGYGPEGLVEEDGTRAFGQLLDNISTDPDVKYSLVVSYVGNDTVEGAELNLVSQGSPADGAVVATRRVTLYDDQTLTAPGATATELPGYSDDPNDREDYYPIPDAAPDGPVYNVVEVRLVVW